MGGTTLLAVATSGIWLLVLSWRLLQLVDKVEDKNSSRTPVRTSSFSSLKSNRSLVEQHSHDAGLFLDNRTLHKLPTNEMIKSLFGKEPVVARAEVNRNQNMLQIVEKNEDKRSIRTPMSTSPLSSLASSRSWAAKHFREAGLFLDNNTLHKLPTNEEITSLFGEEPVVVGTSVNNSQQCFDFFYRVPDPEKRWIGVGGLFNTGTNLLHQLLQQNCIMSTDNSVKWQVPWGKHAFATLSRSKTAPGSKGIVKDDGLVVVAVRDPYEWAKSMCQNPYIIEWEPTQTCPNLTAKVLSWGGSDNLLHFYNIWYQQYLKEFPFPRIFVRMEDLTLRPQSTIKKICDCAGGKTTNKFINVVRSAKEGQGHASTTGMVKSWENVVARKKLRLPIEDYTIAIQSLDDELMALFGYKHPHRR